MAKDPQIELHKQWLGYLQPQGLVVSPLALVEAQAYLNTNAIELQRRFASLLVAHERADDAIPVLPSIRSLCAEFLGWRASDLIQGDQTGIEAPLPEYHETLRPDFAVKEVDPKPDAPHPWLLLVQVLPTGIDFDATAMFADDRRWHATWNARFERLLRESSIPLGLLFNASHVRLVYAPKGESSGALTFSFQQLSEVGGRSMLAGLALLLGEERLFSAGRDQRLLALVEKSRKYQNQVSTELADQVLEALHDLLRGFQAAHAASGETLLQTWLRERPNDIYGGLLTTVLRLIFLLYAEDRGLLGGDATYQSSYSVLGLFERLRRDADRFPDTMDQRYGAWAQLLALFRLVFDGGQHGTLKIPRRHGYLFHPDGGDAEHQFLEGRLLGEPRQVGTILDPPRVSDGVVFRVLSRLMLLDGERISYRTLDVEQIGSVYETMMGFALELTTGPSLAIKPQKPHGAPPVVNLAECLEQPPAKRASWFKEHADFKPTGNVETAVKAASTPEEIQAALGKRVSSLTPRILPAGTMVLQPSDARRKSGSHYTPPQLTRPIVATTLRPIFEQLGPSPKPEQILALKVCDPAMGSGAFLVEACRQLGDALVKSWHAHQRLPKLPPDEDEVIHARRLVAQRCLYGVDKNPFAVALAKLSLWLVTFAKDHPFTFVDHALRCGDSLVGLSVDQIKILHWDRSQRGAYVEEFVSKRLKEVATLRAQIAAAEEGADQEALRDVLRRADEALDDVRLIGDIVIRAFFDGETDKARAGRRTELAVKIDTWLRGGAGALDIRDELRGLADESREEPRGLEPFHWEIEFPEVFACHGFDCSIGNPPFLGGSKVSSNLGDGYRDWLLVCHEGSHGNADIVAHFLRKAYCLLRINGAMGMIGTNTIAQGDTRSTGLHRIRNDRGTIYFAQRRVKWPGDAAVVVSVVCIFKGEYFGMRTLDLVSTPMISAFLFDGGGDDDPSHLLSNDNDSYLGCKTYGQGFIFCDESDDTWSLADMRRMIEVSATNQERIFPYIGGEEVNESATHAYRRFVINFGEMAEGEARARYPSLMELVEIRVKPERMQNKRAARAKNWWLFGERASGLFSRIRGMSRIIAIARHQPHWSATFVPANCVFSEALVVVAMSHGAGFCVMQSRVHEVWARFFGSSLEDRLRYTPTDCFETFPFPLGFDSDPRLEAVGMAYYEFRADLMMRNDEGLTKTYNRFHDPEERSADIAKLRELHAAMDRAVLDAYGWKDLTPTHQFILDYVEADDDDEEGGTRKRKKPWRYRWPDDFRDEVLARLLRLNEERAKEEALHVLPSKSKSTRKSGNKRKSDGGQGTLFDPGDEE